jgi:type IV pilus modification protein PilV
MKPFSFKLQTGIGLIEVLITAVVIAVGLLAVASLQTNFMASSGDSKTRSEALALAEQKIEQFRNNIIVGEYNSLETGTHDDPDNPISGTNTSFTRSWVISDADPAITGSDAPNRKKISVQVSWDNDGNGAVINSDEKVNLVTEIAFLDPAKSAMYAGEVVGGSMAVPSPRQNASEDVASENVNAKTQTPLPATVTATLVNGALPPTITVTGTDGGTYVLSPISTELPTTHYYATAFGNGIIGVFLCTDAGNCTYIQNHFGGVPLRIAGTVYSTSGNGLDHIQVAWSSSEVRSCYNGTKVRNPTSGTLIYDSMAYECVFAGNCNQTANGINNCYPDSDVSDSQINARKVGPGGEYGEVGLIGVDDQGGNREQVCFLEDTTDPATSPLLNVSGSNVQNESYMYAVTKRSYATRRITHSNSINKQKSEGINRSYTNHNFLIIARGSGSTANQQCNLKAGSPRNIQLAPREIIRVLNEDGEPNQVLAGTTYSGASGTAQHLTGSVTGSATDLKLYIPETGGCFLNNNTNSSTPATLYACAVASNAPTSSLSSGVNIYGGSAEHPGVSPAVFASCTKKDSTTCNWLANFSATTSPPTDCSSPWGSNVANGASVTAYLNAAEPFGSTCTSETRTCNNGELDGSYLNQNCVVQPSSECTTPWSTTVTNGSSITAYQLATVPSGATCASENRLCTNGILSGSYINQSCTVETTRTISVTVTPTGTGSVTGITVSGSGATCTGTSCIVPADWTGTLSASGTCSGSPSTVTGSSASLSSTATSTSITLASCAGLACNTPWGSTVNSGGSVAAFSATAVPYGSSCSSIQEIRFCNDGILSGSFINDSCSVSAPANCTFNGNTVTHGSSVTAYSVPAVTSPTTCASVSQTRTCTNGVLNNPTFSNANCSVIYNITLTAANGSGSITTATCNGGSCSGLAPGSYTVAAALSNEDTCSKSYTVSSSNLTVTVTKGTGQSKTCNMSP